jgi:16S rRNA C967 or C1407 C5-methylase (RsmB/RsmF family)/NOL1/NOP2/fmu family ribosome biogenesis protein
MPNLPQQLLNSLEELENFDREAFLKAHEEENRITSVRLNPFKNADLAFPIEKQVPWCSGGYLLSERPSFTLDPLFHAGCYYVQEPGSMYLEFALKNKIDFSQKLNVLDACAAPGGKSTLLNSLISEESLLVSNEVSRSRAGVLAYNLSKWGQENCVVVNNEPQKFTRLERFFDVVVVDAPCSGSGLFRKQPEAVAHWSEPAVIACSSRQKDILYGVIPSLKTGGYLFYSTCSYSPEENEHIIDWMMSEMEMEFVEVCPHKDWGIVDTGKGLRFYPHLTDSEGFFCALLQRKGEPAIQKTRKNRSKGAVSATDRKMIADFLGKDPAFTSQVNDQYHILNESAHDFLGNFSSDFYFRKAGVAALSIKGKDVVPNHELGLWNGLKKDKFLKELSLEDAIKFLKKESFETGFSTMGLALMAFKGWGLGWAKILNNRLNNYLPLEHRILKS